MDIDRYKWIDRWRCDLQKMGGDVVPEVRHNVPHPQPIDRHLFYVQVMSLISHLQPECRQLFSVQVLSLIPHPQPEYRHLL